MNVHDAASPGCGAAPHRRRNRESDFHAVGIKYVIQFTMICLGLVSTSAAARPCARTGVDWNCYYYLGKVDDLEPPHERFWGTRFGAIWLAIVAIFLAVPCYALDQHDVKSCDQSVDWDRKIAGCTKLLTEPRLPPVTLSSVYAARGTGWASKNDFVRAIADFDEALRIDPKNLVALSNRGAAWLLKGETAKAITDLDAVINLNPKKSGILCRPWHAMATVEGIRQVDRRPQ
jgi:tetratricopeptide (TPR) repeat protein